MAILDMFKKKKIEAGSLAPEVTPGMPDLNPPGMPGLSTDQQAPPTGVPNYGPQPEAFTPQPAMQEAHPDSSHSQSEDKNFQIINAKLDAIRTTLEQVNQRIAALEKPEAQNKDKPW